MKASLIFTTYDQSRELSLILEALRLQTTRDFEVIVADDGSDERTKNIIEASRPHCFFTLKHLWQEHKGFRKCQILNKALHVAEGQVLIFLDGDCVPHKEYVQQHLQLQEPGRYVAGRRIDLSREFTEKLTPELVASGYLNGTLAFYWDLFWDCLREGGSTPFHRSYMVRASWLRELTGLDKVPDLKGCNYSVQREHLLRLNGFDERYEGYGREDTDIELRLQHLGLSIKSAKNLCLQFHLWHERRAFTPQNDVLLPEVQASKRIEAVHGLRQRFGDKVI